MSSSDRHGPATRLIHTGERPPAAASLTVPIYETSTFVFDSAADVVLNEKRPTPHPRAFASGSALNIFRISSHMPT